MKLLDGKRLATTIRKKLKQEIDLLTERSPTLSFILIGDNPASHTYVRMKNKRCKEVGILSKTISLKESISERDLIDQIQDLNALPTIDGILVQQPLPKKISPDAVFEAIDPTKDVDGFHPLNLGKLLIGQEDGFTSCTPLGITKLLEAHQIDLEGRHVVIIGRSNIVGKPLAAMLMQKKPHCNATVTLAHSRTKDLHKLCRSADILVAALGVSHFIKKEMIKPGAVIVDVGINRVPHPEHGYTLVGDVAFDEVAPLCSAITPVPGGVGPMTIAMLLSNTLKSYKKRRALCHQ